jgi:hypothetical protein
MDRDKFFSVIGILLIAVVAISTIAFIAGRNGEQQRAVDAGVAEWYATNTGKVEFRYKTGEQNVGQAK